MPYLASSAPLPQNSLDPVPQDEADALDARKMFDFMASRTGRERVYANLPAAASFYDRWPGLAVNAAQIIPQSEVGRESVLYGMSFPADEDTAETLASAPVLVALNADPGTETLDNTSSGSVPNQAPVQLYNGLWDSRKSAGSDSAASPFESSRTVTTHSLATRRKSVSCIGCTAFPLPSNVVAPSLPSPAPAPNPPSPGPITVPRPTGGTVHAVPSPSPNYPDHVTIIDAPASIGPMVQFETLTEAQQFFNSQNYQVVMSGGMSGLSGVLPAWGDASMSSHCQSSQSSNNLGWWALGAVGLLLVVSKKKGRGR